MTRAARLAKRSLAAIAMCAALGCAGDAPPAAEEDTTTTAVDTIAATDTTAGIPQADTIAGDTTIAEPVDLIDPNIAPAIAGMDGWNYHRSAEADVDGDGRQERIVLTARVELYRGRPAWDDGQPWQVYIEERDGTRTYIYAQRLQLGSLTMRLTRGDSASPSVLLLEHLPDRLSVYEATYEGPAHITTLTRFQRDLDPRGDIASPLLQ